MIFSKLPFKPKLDLEEEVVQADKIFSEVVSESEIETETVVGPSVHLQGDFVSEGAIIVKGVVQGSVSTAKQVRVERGAKVIAHVTAGSAYIAGEVKGNIKVAERLDLLSTARVSGDIECVIFSVESGAVFSGKVTMPGCETEEKLSRSNKITSKKSLDKLGAE